MSKRYDEKQTQDHLRWILHEKVGGELLKLVAEHPELPVVFLVDVEGADPWDYSWYYASRVHAEIGELLNNEFWSGEEIINDRDRLEEKIEDYYYEEKGIEGEHELEYLVQEELKKCEKDWVKVIQVSASVE